MAKSAKVWLREAFAALDIPEDLSSWEDFLYHLEMATGIEVEELEGEWMSLSGFDSATSNWLEEQGASHDTNHIICSYDHQQGLDYIMIWLCDNMTLQNQYIVALALYYLALYGHDFGLAIHMTNCHELPDLFTGLGKSLRELSITLFGVVGRVYLPKSISALENLEAFDVFAPVSLFPSWLGRLQKLRYLCFMGCRFAKIHPSLFTLNQLVWLNLSLNDNLKILPPEIGQLDNLNSLDLERTGLESLPETLIQLRQLRRLNLASTEIYHYPANLCSFPLLEYLNLSYCWLVHLPEEILDLGLPFYNSTHRNGIILDGTRLQMMDVDIFFQKTPEELHLYYREMEIGEVYTDEVRVIFIGNGDAGKTTIINRLLTGKYAANPGQTKGVAIRPWRVPIEDGEQTRQVTLNIWDFGGQEIMHSMHNYFMGERCLYVIVLDGRKDEEPETWLDLVSQYGQKSPVMLVMNKIDDNASAEIDRGKIESLYGERFPALSYHYISCKQGTRFREFQQKLLQTVARTESYKMRFPRTWNRVRLALKHMSGNYISERDYVSLCEQQGIHEPETQRSLLCWLNDFGVCFSYHSPQNRGVIEDTKVLRPEWITNGIYKIINSEAAKQANGFLPHGEIVEILQQEDGENPLYHNMERDFILDMMRDFEYSYAIGDREFFPMLTAKTQPRQLPQEFFAETALQYQFHYQALLPAAILYNFIVYMREDVEVELTWRRGVVLRHQDSRALVRFGKDNRVLELFVCGPHEQACAYLNLLIYHIRRLQKSIRIEHREYVRYRTRDSSALVDVDRSQEMLMQGLERDYITELGETVSLIDVLRSYSPQAVIDWLMERKNQPPEWQKITRHMERMDGRLAAMQGGIREQQELLMQIHFWLEQANPVLLRQQVAELQQQAAQVREEEIVAKLAEVQQLLSEQKTKSAGAVFLEVVNQCANVATLAPVVGKLLSGLSGMVNLLP